MKKVMVITMGALLSIGLLTSCVVRQIPAPQSPPEGSPSQTQSAPSTPAPSQNTVDTSTFIGEDRAKAIALEKAGITADGVFFDRVELDRDNGVWHYEVEFKKGFTEYDADVHAVDGTILSWDMDID